jgi:hypothetical protein
MRQIAALLAILLLAACASERAVMTPAELRTCTSAAIASNEKLVDRMQQAFTASLEADLAAGRTPSIDILALSGGADWGAFGAGFLHAWSQRPADDALAMPDFDLITGISTGSLIAPFTALGKHAEIVELFRNSSPDWSRARIVSSLISGQGLYDISRLEQAIATAYDRTILPALDDPRTPRRNVVIATADVDLGFLRIWDVHELAADRDRFRAVQRAAIAIPAAFDPVLVDGTLQADAGILMQLVAVAQPERLASWMGAWNAAHPERPVRLRYWVVANNRTAEPPTTVQPTWHALLGRSSAMMMKAGVMAPLTTLWLQTELLRREGLEVEFRWIAIPPDFPIDLSISPFDQRITRALSDLGREIGARPDPWLRQPPSPIRRP